MNNQFDELAKRLAQSVTRRGALKNFGLGLAGIALACFGLANKAQAGWRSKKCFENCYDHCIRQGGTDCSIVCGSLCHPPIP